MFKIGSYLFRHSVYDGGNSIYLRHFGNVHGKDGKGAKDPKEKLADGKGETQAKAVTDAKKSSVVKQVESTKQQVTEIKQQIADVKKQATVVKKVADTKKQDTDVKKKDATVKQVADTKKQIADVKKQATVVKQVAETKKQDTDVKKKDATVKQVADTKKQDTKDVKKKSATDVKKVAEVKKQASDVKQATKAVTGVAGVKEASSKKEKGKSHDDKKSPKKKKYPLLIAFGNPILDVTLKVKNDSIFKKYKLIPDSQYLKTSKQINDIKRDALKFSEGKQSSNPGGSSLNTARILGTLLKPDNYIMYCGAIGNDEKGTQLVNLMKKADVKVQFEVIKNQPTGNCLCLVWKDNACLIADIGAALKYNLEHIKKDTLLEYLQNTSFVYIEGFFIANRVKACEYLLKDICQKHGVMYVMNLSAAYVIDRYPKQCQMLSENADAVFGNAEQFMQLGKMYNLKNLESIMWHLLKAHPYSKKKCPNFKNKLLVATNGPDPINMFYIRNDQMCHEVYPIPKIAGKNIVDTTGAGDAFLAGFLAAFLKDKTPLECAESGSVVAADIIKHIGVNLSRKFKLA